LDSLASLTAIANYHNKAEGKKVLIRRGNPKKMAMVTELSVSEFQWLINLGMKTSSRIHTVLQNLGI